jgi:hypothetical protein
MHAWEAGCSLTNNDQRQASAIGGFLPKILPMWLITSMVIHLYLHQSYEGIFTLNKVPSCPLHARTQLALDPAVRVPEAKPERH